MTALATAAAQRSVISGVVC